MRRWRAWELKGKGWKQKDITEALGVSEGAGANGSSEPKRGVKRPCMPNEGRATCPNER